MGGAAPPAEVNIDARLIRALLEEQHSDLARLSLGPTDAISGWDNVMVRLGETLCVRLPRRSAAVKCIEHEQQCLPLVAKLVPLPVPVPVRIGVPGCGYPSPWSVVPWLPGAPADLAPPGEKGAGQWGRFLRALHVLAPERAPENPWRGGPLAARAAVLEDRLQWVAARTPHVTLEIRRGWEEALVEPIDSARMWIHGDLHALNVLVEDEAFSGVIDWGDITGGDPATDLASIWMLFSDSRARRLGFDVYGPISEATYRRAKGWAIAFAVTLLDARLADNQRLAEIGRRTLGRVTADC